MAWTKSAPQQQLGGTAAKEKMLVERKGKLLSTLAETDIESQGT
jgi:hypothetical protein